jgi:hypothetical protein
MNDEMGVQWRKSSYSTGDAGGNECVEVAWQKSSHSTGDGSGNECVEVARPDHTVTALRDSKAPDTGHIHVPAWSFDAFVTRIKAGS